MTNEHVIAHAACPVCGVDAGEPCEGTLLPGASAPGVHAGRHNVLNLPTLEDIARGRRMRQRLAELRWELL